MNNAELDVRIAKCGREVQKLCDDLSIADPTIEQAVALGALSACAAILSMLAGLTSQEVRRERSG